MAFQRAKVFRFVMFVISISAAQDIKHGDSHNITQSKKIIDWNRPLKFEHILDSQDVSGTLISGIILTLAIVFGLALFAAAFIFLYNIKERFHKGRKNYGRLYNENITSVQNAAQKV